MKLSLVVEGKEQKVCSAHFREGKVNGVSVLDENNVVVTYHDTKEKTVHYVEKPLQIDFDTCLKWVDRYAGVEELIRKRIEAKEEKLIELAAEFMEISISDSYPFPEIEGESLKREYIDIKKSLRGLHEALDIVYELGGVNNGSI